VFLNKYYSADQLRVEQTGGASGMHGGEEMLTRFWWRKTNDRGHLEDLYFGGWMIERNMT